MNELIDRFCEVVEDTLIGIDRIVFKGMILPLMSAIEAMDFFRSRVYDSKYLIPSLGQVKRTSNCLEKLVDIFGCFEPMG